MVVFLSVLVLVEEGLVPTFAQPFSERCMTECKELTLDLVNFFSF